MKIDACLLPCTSINSYKTWNFEASAGKNRNTLKPIDIGNDFLNRTQIAQQLRERLTNGIPLYSLPFSPYPVIVQQFSLRFIVSCSYTDVTQNFRSFVVIVVVYGIIINIIVCIVDILKCFFFFFLASSFEHLI
jgi:hypothetical protein